jgi:hypothetical protein
MAASKKIEAEGMEKNETHETSLGSVDVSKREHGPIPLEQRQRSIQKLGPELGDGQLGLDRRGRVDTLKRPNFCF